MTANRETAKFDRLLKDTRPTWVSALLRTERAKARKAGATKATKEAEARATVLRAEIEGLHRVVAALTTQRNEAQHRAENQNQNALTETAGAVRALNDANLGNARLRESAEEWKQRALRAEGALAERHRAITGDEVVVDVAPVPTDAEGRAVFCEHCSVQTVRKQGARFCSDCGPFCGEPDPALSAPSGGFP